MGVVRVHFEGPIEVVRIDSDGYTVDVAGHRFAFKDRLRIGIQIVNGVMVPIEMPVLDAERPDMLVAFAISGDDAQRIVDEGLTAGFKAPLIQRPLVSLN